jgi:antitoxin CptB
MRDILSQATDQEHPDVRRRRLVFRCWHRGTLESDFILGSFAEDSLETLDSSQLGRFEALLDCTDPTCLTGYSASAIRRRNMIMT